MESKSPVVTSEHASESFWVIAHPGSSEKQVGAECCEPDKNIWGVDLPAEVDEYEEKD